MAKQPDYLYQPFRQVSDLSQVYVERDRFIAVLLEVLLLGAVLNYFATIFFEFLNSPGAIASIWLWSQLLVSLALVVGILFAITHIDILKPIQMNTMFYTGILIRPAQAGKPSLLFEPPTDFGNRCVQRIVRSIADT